MSKSHLDATKAYCSALMRNYSSYAASTRSDGCSPDFDSSLCWKEAEVDTTVGQACPFEFCSGCPLLDEDRMVTRRCQTGGNWSHANYDQCVYIYFNVSNCIARPCHPCPHAFRETVRNVTLILSILSALTLIASVSLFAVLKSIQCRRLTIHAHLASAFILRFIAYTVWIPMQRDQIFYGCGNLVSREDGNWLCKTILFVIMYATVATTFWMFVEGAYLISRFTVYAMRASEGPLWLCMVVGWVLPLVFVSLWAVALELQPGTSSFCWLPYTSTWALWLLVGPMSTALVINVLFLIVVIIVLIQKMHTSSSSETTKIWQTIKATLLLVPLLGVSNLLLFYEPSERETLAFQVYMLITAVLQHSQGIFVAILYCFANGEVQGAVKRAVKKLRLSQQLSKKTHRTRSYTVVSTSEAAVAGAALTARSPSANAAMIEQVRIIQHQRDDNGGGKDGATTPVDEKTSNALHHHHQTTTTTTAAVCNNESPAVVVVTTSALLSDPPPDYFSAIRQQDSTAVINGRSSNGGEMATRIIV